MAAIVLAVNGLSVAVSKTDTIGSYRIMRMAVPLLVPVLGLVLIVVSGQSAFLVLATPAQAL